MDDIEDIEYVASEHDRLVSAISKLDKTQHITEPTRNEPTNINAEFGLLKRTKKLDFSNVVDVLGGTCNHLGISKKLRRVQDGSKTLPKPLEKPQVERIKRATGYEETKNRIGRWDPVVARNRTVDFVSFPLKSVTGKQKKVNPTTEFVARLTTKSELEKELDEIDPPAVEGEEEEEKNYPMTYEDMVEHRQHLAKMRAQQSYQAAKAKRQSKIKSKKYHRILKKERLKQQLKEFEDLQKTDPEEALKKLEALEKTRALERHTLRHKNTGKWAKSKLVRAKYDKEVRQQLAEQLSVSRGLTQKTKNAESSDDEDDNNKAIPDVTLARDPMNPWMLQRSNKSNINEEFNFGYKKYLNDRMYKRKEESEDKSDKNDEHDNDLNIIKENMKKLIDNDSSDSDNKEEEKVTVKVPENKPPPAPRAKRAMMSKLVATSQWNVEVVENNDDKPAAAATEVTAVFDSFEDDVANKVEQKLKKIRQNIERLEKNKTSGNKNKKKEEKQDTDNIEYLKLKSKKVKPILDEALHETFGNVQDEPQNKKTLSKIPDKETTPQNEQNLDVDPSRFIEVKPKYLNTTLPSGENELDHLDDDQIVPRVNIEEVFEEDDVVANFRQEKEDEINKDNPEDIELSLPGWGSWGGKGVKAPKRKKNRFILKAPPKVPRRDENKGDIIIKEYKDPKLSAHKVVDVPFPFNSVKEYEASIRAPLGNTFVPEKAYKQLIKPSVFTRAGAVIEPMTQDELLSKKNKIFNNESVIKLLGQK